MPSWCTCEVGAYGGEVIDGVLELRSSYYSGDQVIGEVLAQPLLQWAHADSFWDYFMGPRLHNKNRNSK